MNRKYQIAGHLFEVSGDVLLPSEMTLQVLSNPESFPAGLIKAKMGEVGDDTEWIVYGKSGLSVKIDKEGLILSKIGLVMSIR